MKKNIKFEDAMLRLEEIVEGLEGEGLSLDAAIEAYEEAVSLVRICNEQLEAAEQKIRLLTKTEDGSVTDVPFDAEDAN